MDFAPHPYTFEVHKMPLLIVGIITIVITSSHLIILLLKIILPWLRTALSYISSPDEFLAHCQKQYGNVRDVVVISSASATSSIYAANHNMLGIHETHNVLYYAVSGSKSSSAQIYHVITRLLFPMLDQCLLRHSMGDLTAPIALALRYPKTTYEDLCTPDVTMPKCFYKVPFCLKENAWTDCCLSYQRHLQRRWVARFCLQEIIPRQQYCTPQGI
ncbi:hypothetical protein EDC04DRAFT_2778195 [Pisolithus marmoratus]|nr:hypothetical protein EDC04DRAFT_2778195 [Pisolithus marmoratus]